MKPFTVGAVPALVSGEGSFASFLDTCRKRGVDDLALVCGESWFPQSRFDLLVSDAFSDRCVRRFTTTGEPGPSVIDTIAGELRSSPPDLVLAVGGGSVIDTGKAVAAMICETGSVEDFLEGVGTRAPSGERIAFAAAPTTAGTGSEATKNAVVSRVGPEGYKKSLRHDRYVPDYAILDPALTVSCPKAVTVSAGLDTVTQLLEAYVSKAASVFTTVLAAQGLEIAATALPAVVESPDDLDLRHNMAYAAYLSGIALANAGLGIVHGLASPLGAVRHAPHGAICAALIPSATKKVTRSLAALEHGSPGYAAYAAAGRICTRCECSDTDAVEHLCRFLEELNNRLGAPSLKDLGFTVDELTSSSSAASAKNTPCDLTTDDVNEICLEAYSS